MKTQRKTESTDSPIYVIALINCFLVSYCKYHIVRNLNKFTIVKEKSGKFVLAKGICIEWKHLADFGLVIVC